jgi:hypothetical protein
MPPGATKEELEEAKIKRDARSTPFNPKIFNPDRVRWCFECNAYKPPRAHHCRDCKVFVYIALQNYHSSPQEPYNRRIVSSEQKSPSFSTLFSPNNLLSQIAQKTTWRS